MKLFTSSYWCIIWYKKISRYYPGKTTMTTQILWIDFLTPAIESWVFQHPGTSIRFKKDLTVRSLEPKKVQKISFP